MPRAAFCRLYSTDGISVIGRIFVQCNKAITVMLVCLFVNSEISKLQEVKKVISVGHHFEEATTSPTIATSVPSELTFVP